MLVSFIIPFYGSALLLKRCLGSIAAQTDGDYEAIVVDDCSPEDGEAITRSFGSRFRYVRQSVNSSAFQARNRAVREAKGSLVVPVDPDDYVLPELVAEIKKEINFAVSRHPLDSSSSPDLIIYNVEQDTAGVISPHWCRYEVGRLDALEALRRMSEKRLQWNVWAKAIRRERWLEILDLLPQSETVYMNASEDFCIAVPLVLTSRWISVIDYVGYRYWQNSLSICNAVSPTKAWHALIDTLRARRMVLDFIVLKGCACTSLPYVRTISHMILAWWVRECVVTMKKRILGRRM